LTGLAAVGVIWLLARYLFGRRCGWIAAGLLAISHLGVYYSQEARPYMLMLLWNALCVYLFLRALRERRLLFWWGFVACAILAMYTHYYSIFPLLCLAGFAVAQRKTWSVPWTWWLAGAAVCVVSYLPWLASGVVAEVRGSAKLALAGIEAGVRWETLPGTVNWFNNGKVFGARPGSPWWSLPLGGLLFTVPALLALRPLLWFQEEERQDRPLLLLTGLLWLLPMLAVLGVSAVFRIQYYPRYLLFSLPPYYILVARGLANIQSPARLGGVLAAILMFSTLALRAHYTVPFKGDTEAGVAFLATGYRTGDCCCFLSYRGHNRRLRQWDIYRKNGPQIDQATVEDAASDTRRCRRLWFVFYRNAVTPFGDGLYAATRRKIEGTHRLLLERKFEKVWLNLYVPLAGEKGGSGHAD
jgi:4-amino-4-deoxy-L-arabinose transferase-like glycosyltransferase